MPELPEVENFRLLLVPLVSPSSRLQVTLVNDKPPRRFLSTDDVKLINSSECHVENVVRKGKLICMILQPTKDTIINKLYLFLHMGMTGRISTPDYLPPLESLKEGNINQSAANGTGESAILPPHTFLKLTAGDAQAFFSDPRKFGAVTLHQSSLDEGGFGELAPDALELAVSLSSSATQVAVNSISSSINNNALHGLVGQRTGIKTILLDQKRVMSGVGNWVADEVLYQCHMHPDQTHLTQSHAQQLMETLVYILNTAIACLQQRHDFPDQWLFHCRWNKRNEGKVKDPQGRMVGFIKSAGRTSAIVPSIQKKTAGVKQVSNIEVHAIGDSKQAATKKRKLPTKNGNSDDADTIPPKKATIVKKDSASKDPPKNESATKPKKSTSAASVEETLVESLPKTKKARVTQENIDQPKKVAATKRFRNKGEKDDQDNGKQRATKFVKSKTCDNICN
jgi:formamidopyrimidine-DNA glycosylase